MPRGSRATSRANSRRRRRSRAPAITVLILAAAAVAVATGLIVSNQGNPAGRRAASAVHTATRNSPAPPVQSTTSRTSTPTGSSATASAAVPPPPHRVHRGYGVGIVAVRIVDPSRKIETASGPVRRSFETIVRYPAVTGLGQAAGPFPLVVFGHGYAVTPEPYKPLLDAWTKAGFVVAAPVFPLENANAPGGPNEQDLPNQPRDMSMVISSMIAASERGAGRLRGIINPRQIAVTGQSDGGDTALAAADDPTVRDPRVGAAMILSGAEDPFAPPFAMPSKVPPLLAVQGTADTINPPSDTYKFYGRASPPKALLRLIGASHQPPYTEPGPELDAVVRTTVAFLNAVFRDRPQRLHALLAAGNAGPSTALSGRGW